MDCSVSVVCRLLMCISLLKHVVQLLLLCASSTYASVFRMPEEHISTDILID
jgi:hypothetical protein